MGAKGADGDDLVVDSGKVFVFSRSQNGQCVLASTLSLEPEVVTVCVYHKCTAITMNNNEHGLFGKPLSHNACLHMIINWCLQAHLCSY